MFGTEGLYLWWLIPIVLIGICLFFCARGCCSGRRHSALDILDSRYARGEIDDEEYERKNKAITQEKKGDRR